MTKRWKHDCSACTHMGGLVTPDGVYDLYHCRKQGELTTLVARYGNKGSEYASMPALAAAETSMVPLRVALTLWAGRVV